MHKPPLPLALLALLALTGTAHASDDKALWKAVFQLDEADHQKGAASVLRANGAAGYDVLSKVARAGGERAALATTAQQLGCFLMGMHVPTFAYSEGNLQRSATRLATELIQEDKALRESLLGAEEPFDRAMALLVSAAVPGALPGALKRLENEKEPRVLELVEGASRCARMRTGEQVGEEAERLSRKLEGSAQQPRCEQAGFAADALVAGLMKDRYRIAGWSRSNEEFSVTVKRGADASTSLAPPCALALYDELAKRGKYEPGLVVTLSEQLILPVSTRDAAARRAVRDLKKYPEADRNKLAAQLVNAGYDVPVKVTYKAEDTFAQETELEAAVRQGSKQALVDVERFALCRGSFGGNGLAMLGYLKTPDAAQTAFQLAEQCPHALKAATAALLRMKDPRALDFLPKALQPGGFGGDELNRAAVESYTPALGRELHRLAAQDESSEAKDVLRLLKLAGVARD